MGYYIRTPQTSFAIRTENLPRFFELVANLMSDENVEENGHGGSYAAGGEKMRGWYSWVNTDDVRTSIADRDISAVFAGWGYDLELTNEYDGVTNYYLDIRGGDAKIGDEETFFAAIAPVVEDGSFLDVIGEDDTQWRWMWENGKFFVQDVLRKEIIFSEPNEIVFQDANKNKEIA
jgi:hypothetical protein